MRGKLICSVLPKDIVSIGRLGEQYHVKFTGYVENILHNACVPILAFVPASTVLAALHGKAIAYELRMKITKLWLVPIFK